MLKRAPKYIQMGGLHTRYFNFTLESKSKIPDLLELKKSCVELCESQRGIC